MAANVLSVPYLGYVECEVIVLGKVFHPSFGELSEATSSLGADLSSKLGSMLHITWLQSQLTISICIDH